MRPKNVCLRYLEKDIFFNSDKYDLAIIQSFFGIFQIRMTFLHNLQRHIFENIKTLLIEQI